ncbi:hypothetical protein M885DRAFT_569801 [Pelagophyceae sp. CCMP2097]|nr:hypothetical protein M885DRAFT_569801 [Pelagophyceae sp. CCMP2097]
MQVPARSGASTRGLDAADRHVPGDITNMGGDKRKQNAGSRGPRAPPQPIEKLRSALALWATEQVMVAKPISHKDAGAKFGISKGAVNTMAKKLAPSACPNMMIRLRASMGFPLDVYMLSATFLETLRAMGRDTESYAGRPVVCSRRFVNKFLVDCGLGKYKTSVIDPKRVKQATEEVRKAWYDLNDHVVARAFQSGQTTWAKPKEVPAKNKFNINKAAHDSTAGRKKVVGDKNARKSTGRASSNIGPKAMKQARYFERGDGDKAAFHMTDVATTTCANGTSLAIMLVMSCPGVDAPCMRAALMKHTVRPATTDEERASPFFPNGLFNAEGIDVRVTTNGSMTRLLFPRWCEHFVRNLPVGLGKGGGAVFLYVDGHASRWTGFTYRLRV